MKKLSRLLSIFLAVLMLVGVIAVAPISADAATPAWKTAYINYINKISSEINDSGGWAWLKDLDGNGVPELFISCAHAMGATMVITYYNGELITTTASAYGTVYVLNNMFLLSYGRQGYYGDTVYKQNGSASVVFDGTRVIKDYNLDYSNTNNYIYKYSVNGSAVKQVSYSQYNSALNSAFNKSKAGVLNYNKCYHSTSQIISAINSFTSPTPGTPNVSLTNKANGLYASWAKTANTANYKVYFKKSTDSYWSTATTTNNYWTLPNAVSGALYYVQVQGVSAGGVTGGYSKVKSMTFVGPTAITSLTYNGSNTLYYSYVPGANKYQIARKKSGDSAYSYFTTANTSFTESAVGGVAYTYQVRAMYATANSGTAYGAWSSGKSVATLVAPTVTSLYPTNNALVAKWNSIKGAAKYIVYFKTADASKWNSATVTGTSINITGVKSGTTYFVQVRAIGSTVNGPYSKAVFMTYAPPSKPVVTLQNSKGIFVQWSRVTGATSYTVYYKTASETEFHKTEGLIDNLVINKGLKIGERYYVQVRPYYYNQPGLISDVKSIVFTLK